MPLKDDSIIEHHIGQREEDHEWILLIKCVTDKISREEFAIILISLGEDILDGSCETDVISIPVDESH